MTLPPPTGAAPDALLQRPHMPTSKRFSLDRFDSELLGMTAARQMSADPSI